MTKRWRHYERRPRSHYLLFMGIMSALLATVQMLSAQWWIATAWAVACAVNLSSCLRERRKERAGQGTLI